MGHHTRRGGKRKKKSSCNEDHEAHETAPKLDCNRRDNALIRLRFTNR